MSGRESNKGELIRKWDEKVPVERLKNKHYWNNMPRSETRGCGIYVLFNGNEPYYVGKADKSLRWRISKHTRDKKHRGKWNCFSFYQTRRSKYTKDLETILLRVLKPPGNSIKGRLPSKLKLTKMVRMGEKKE